VHLLQESAMSRRNCRSIDGRVDTYDIVLPAGDNSPLQRREIDGRSASSNNLTPNPNYQYPYLSGFDVPTSYSRH